MDQAIAIWILVQWKTGGLRKPFDKCWFGNPQSKFTLFITNKNQSSYSTNLYKHINANANVFFWINRCRRCLLICSVKCFYQLKIWCQQFTLDIYFNMGVPIVTWLKPINNSYSTIILCTNSLFNFLLLLLHRQTFHNVKRTWKLNIAFWPAKFCYSCGKNCWLN